MAVPALVAFFAWLSALLHLCVHAIVAFLVSFGCCIYRVEATVIRATIAVTLVATMAFVFTRRGVGAILSAFLLTQASRTCLQRRLGFSIFLHLFLHFSGIVTSVACTAFVHIALIVACVTLLPLCLSHVSTPVALLMTSIVTSMAWSTSRSAWIVIDIMAVPALVAFGAWLFALLHLRVHAIVALLVSFGCCIYRVKATVIRATIAVGKTLVATMAFVYTRRGVGAILYAFCLIKTNASASVHAQTGL
jgi:hypothetical protein